MIRLYHNRMAANEARAGAIRTFGLIDPHHPAPSEITGVLRARGPASSVPAGLYGELKRLIRQKGLLDRQPAYYGFIILVTAGLLAFSLAALFVLNSLWMQALNAALLAFIFTQVSFIGHDVGHRQIFKSVRKNNVVGLICWNLLLGMSSRGFTYRHNLHHARPNVFDSDPDCDLHFLTFSEEQGKRRRGLSRSLIKHQVLLLPLLAFVPSIVLRISSANFLFRASKRFPSVEVALIAIHVVWYGGLLYYAIGLWPAILFIAVNQVLFGTYLASVIATNHKGMPMLEEGAKLDFLLQQLLTSRDIKSHRLTDFWFGGLNYQAEHHLFPSMPRNNLREAATIVKQFCHERFLPYCQVSTRQFYGELFDTLRTVSSAAEHGNARVGEPSRPREKVPA